MVEPHGSALGRPRDPSLEQRVFEAACRVFARHGWAGTSVEAVAREAKVGKSSIYRRWTDVGSLLEDSLAALIALPLDVDTGSAREDLVVLARALSAVLSSDMGETLIRLSAEAAAIPQLWSHWRVFVDTADDAVSTVIQRGIDRGELRPDTQVVVLLHALYGGILINYLKVADRKAPRLIEEADAYARTVVDLVLKSAAP